MSESCWLLYNVYFVSIVSHLFKEFLDNNALASKVKFLTSTLVLMTEFGLFGLIENEPAATVSSMYNLFLP